MLVAAVTPVQAALGLVRNNVAPTYSYVFSHAPQGRPVLGRFLKYVELGNKRGGVGSERGVGVGGDGLGQGLGWGRWMGAGAKVGRGEVGGWG